MTGMAGTQEPACGRQCAGAWGRPAGGTTPLTNYLVVTAKPFSCQNHSLQLRAAPEPGAASLTACHCPPGSERLPSRLQSPLVVRRSAPERLQSGFLSLSLPRKYCSFHTAFREANISSANSMSTRDYGHSAAIYAADLAIWTCPFGSRKRPHTVKQGKTRRPPLETGKRKYHVLPPDGLPDTIDRLVGRNITEIPCQSTFFGQLLPSLPSETRPPRRSEAGIGAHRIQRQRLIFSRQQLASLFSHASRFLSAAAELLNLAFEAAAGAPPAASQPTIFLLTGRNVYLYIHMYKYSS